MMVMLLAKLGPSTLSPLARALMTWPQATPASCASDLLEQLEGLCPQWRTLQLQLADDHPLVAKLLIVSDCAPL